MIDANKRNSNETRLKMCQRTAANITCVCVCQAYFKLTKQKIVVCGVSMTGFRQYLVISIFFTINMFLNRNLASERI